MDCSDILMVKYIHTIHINWWTVLLSVLIEGRHSMMPIHSQLNDDAPHKIIFHRSSLFLEHLKNVNLLPDKQAVMQLLGMAKKTKNRQLNNEVQPVPLLLRGKGDTATSIHAAQKSIWDLEQILWKTCIEYHCQSVQGKQLSSKVISDYLQGYLNKRNDESCKNHSERKRSHFFTSAFMDKFQPNMRMSIAVCSFACSAICLQGLCPLFQSRADYPPHDVSLRSIVIEFEQ